MTRNAELVPRCGGWTAHGQCERKAAFWISVPGEKPKYACRIHIGQVVKRWAGDPVFARIQVTHVDYAPNDGPGTQ